MNKYSKGQCQLWVDANEPSDNNENIIWVKIDGDGLLVNSFTLQDGRWTPIGINDEVENYYQTFSSKKLIEIGAGIGVGIDTSIPEAPSDERVPSTKMFSNKNKELADKTVQLERNTNEKFAQVEQESTQSNTVFTLHNKETSLCVKKDKLYFANGFVMPQGNSVISIPTTEIDVRVTSNYYDPTKAWDGVVEAYQYLGFDAKANLLKLYDWRFIFNIDHLKLASITLKANSAGLSPIQINKVFINNNSDSVCDPILYKLFGDYYDEMLFIKGDNLVINGLIRTHYTYIGSINQPTFVKLLDRQFQSIYVEKGGSLANPNIAFAAADNYDDPSLNRGIYEIIATIAKRDDGGYIIISNILNEDKSFNRYTKEPVVTEDITKDNNKLLKVMKDTYIKADGFYPFNNIDMGFAVTKKNIWYGCIETSEQKSYGSKVDDISTLNGQDIGFLNCGWAFKASSTQSLVVLKGLNQFNGSDYLITPITFNYGNNYITETLVNKGISDNSLIDEVGSELFIADLNKSREKFIYLCGEDASEIHSNVLVLLDDDKNIIKTLVNANQSTSKTIGKPLLFNNAIYKARYAATYKKKGPNTYLNTCITKCDYNEDLTRTKTIVRHSNSNIYDIGGSGGDVSSKGFLPQEDKVRFKVSVNCFHATTSESLVVQDGEDIHNDFGVLMLPRTYDPNGKPTRMLIMCHGAGGSTDANDSQTEKSELAKKMVTLGYAVMDVNGLPATFAEREGINLLNNIGSPIAVQCYKKGYDWCVANYNICTDGVLLWGGSMGGLSSLNVATWSGIPIIAHGLLAPVTELEKQAFDRPWSGGAPKVAIAKLYKFTDANVYDAAKVGGYNPATSNSWLIGADRYKIYPIPLKIWHAKSDGTVDTQYSIKLVDSINRTGGNATLRILDGNTHGPDQLGDIAETFTYLGTSVSMRTLYTEAYKWLIRWGK